MNKDDGAWDDEKTDEQRMDEFFESVHFDEIGDWRSMPETDSDDDEDESDEPGILDCAYEEGLDCELDDE